MTNRAIRIGVFLIAAGVLFTPGLTAADSAWAGTWKLNVVKSKYDPGPAPKANTQKIEAIDNGLKVTANGTNAQGQKTHNEYTVKLDGKDYPQRPMLDGKPNPDGADTIAFKKIDDHTNEITIKRKGQVVVTITDRLSPDGKTRTGTTKGTDAQGQKVNNVAVWEKQ